MIDEGRPSPEADQSGEELKKSEEEEKNNYILGEENQSLEKMKTKRRNKNLSE